MEEEDIPMTTCHTHEGHYDFLVIPFGLCNTLSIFMSFMKKIFRLILCKFVLLFFGDVLIYNKTWASQVEHVDIALQLQQDHQLLPENSECVFETSKFEYLGHLVSQERM